MGVFGNPITEETLEGLPRYEGKEIGAVDRARVALNWITAEGKDVKALQYAADIKEKYCKTDVATICLIYNATGSTLEFAGHKDWYGHRATAPYPIMIQNGQWGAFLHRQISGASDGSIAAVVYRGTNADNEDRDWMLAWNNPCGRDKTAYTEARELDHYYNGSLWDYILNERLTNSDVANKSDWGGCLSFVAIGNDDFSIFRAIMTLENANKN